MGLNTEDVSMVELNTDFNNRENVKIRIPLPVMKKIITFLLITIMMLPGMLWADNKDVSLEDKTKAAFIYNFTK